MKTNNNKLKFLYII